MDNIDLCATLQQRLGITIDPQDTLWLRLCCHASYDSDNSYECLEFLGDRVLGLVIAALLYRLYPDSDEGGLAQRHAYLVSTEILVQIAAETPGLKPAILLKGNALTPSICADVVESLIGYLYLRHGMIVAEKFVFQGWNKRAKALTKPPRDPRSVLQEIVMQQQATPPEYRLVAQTGQDHQPHFVFTVHALGTQATGEGMTKQMAKAQAAQTMLQRLKDT